VPAAWLAGLRRLLQKPIGLCGRPAWIGWWRETQISVLPLVIRAPSRDARVQHSREKIKRGDNACHVCLEVNCVGVSV
jgi:hypothetical protein